MNPSDNEAKEMTCLGKNPAAWFTHVEAIFTLRRITSHQAKFYHAVTALSTEVVAEFYDVVGAPHETTPYDHFKAVMLHHTSVSVPRRLQQLLNEEELGDRRPSELLRGMRRLLSDNDLSLNKLVELAGRVVDYSARGTVATASTVPLSQLEDRQSRLEQLIDDLAETVNALYSHRPTSSTRPRFPFQIVS
ncbi:uncharacterized protein LOC125941420 [Dermacentor silvarum]|uniref:uncharacterized protein LOC125941420 n=1 Tax=Dermacentor silvarum TaxID=543639 RepID=UPI0021018859|nr:uncharacterized protein LOC125941420 [Dermacentor silvarum]